MTRDPNPVLCLPVIPVVTMAGPRGPVLCRSWLHARFLGARLLRYSLRHSLGLFVLVVVILAKVQVLGVVFQQPGLALDQLGDVLKAFRIQHPCRFSLMLNAL